MPQCASHVLHVYCPHTSPQGLHNHQHVAPPEPPATEHKTSCDSGCLSNLEPRCCVFRPQLDARPLLHKCTVDSAAAAHRARHWLQCETRSPVTAAAAAAAANAQWWQPCVRLQLRLRTHAPVSRHQSRRRVDAHSRFWANKRGLCDSEPVLICIFSTFHHTRRTGSALCRCCPRLGASLRVCGVLNQAGLRPGHAEREAPYCFVTTWWCGRRKPHEDQLWWNRTVSQRPAGSCRHHLHTGLFWAKQLQPSPQSPPTQEMQRMCLKGFLFSLHSPFTELN